MLICLSATLSVCIRTVIASELPTHCVTSHSKPLFAGSVIPSCWDQTVEEVRYHLCQSCRNPVCYDFTSVPCERVSMYQNHHAQYFFGEMRKKQCSKTAMSVSDRRLVTSGTVHIAARLTGLMARIEKDPINISVDLRHDPFA